MKAKLLRAFVIAALVFLAYLAGTDSEPASPSPLVSPLESPLDAPISATSGSAVVLTGICGHAALWGVIAGLAIGPILLVFAVWLAWKVTQKHRRLTGAINRINYPVLKDDTK